MGYPAIRSDHPRATLLASMALSSGGATDGRRIGRDRAGRVDFVLIGAAATLFLIGAMSVYAATRGHLVGLGRDGGAYLKRDVINLAVGLVVAVPVAFVDYRLLRTVAPALYGGLCLLLVLVLSPLGSTINGAHAWFTFGPVQLEPSEFMKLAVILLLAGLLSERRDREPDPDPREIVVALAAAGLPVLLILAEPALGIAIILAVIALTVLVVAGSPARWIVGLLLGVVVAGGLAASLHLLKPYQEQRFTSFASDHPASSSTGYQIQQSLIAVGSGGLTGQGFLTGTQTDGGFVPEQQTDFVFTVAAGEAGFAGGAATLLVLGVLLWRALTIAQKAPDLYGRAVAGGIVMWFAFQSFANIGMTMGIMPVTGLPLPFVSYGGSALFADLLACAILINISHAGRSRTVNVTA